MTFSSAKNKDDDDTGSAKSSMGPRVLTVRELAGTCGCIQTTVYPKIIEITDEEIREALME
jgi:hypothetical protein